MDLIVCCVQAIKETERCPTGHVNRLVQLAKRFLLGVAGWLRVSSAHPLFQLTVIVGTVCGAALNIICGAALNTV